MQQREENMNLFRPERFCVFVCVIVSMFVVRPASECRVKCQSLRSVRGIDGYRYQVFTVKK